MISAQAALSSPPLPAAARLLLVEDEATNMAILGAYLRNAGYHVEQAVDGLAAREILGRDNRFALIVTDRRMPNLDGLQLAHHVRNDNRLKHIPVIMQTSADTQSEMLEGIRAGVFYYLVKPYEEETLLAIVNSAMLSRKQQSVFEARASRQNGALELMTSGEFSLRTPEHAENLALLLGALFMRPDLAAVGLYELMLNAIEHGNLGIGYDMKNRLLVTAEWEAEIDRRLAAPANAGKLATVRYRATGDRHEVTIADTGPGFDWRPFMQIEPSRATRGNGRGIAKAAQLSFDSVVFTGNGNTVTITAR